MLPDQCLEVAFYVSRRSAGTRDLEVQDDVGAGRFLTGDNMRPIVADRTTSDLSRAAVARALDASAVPNNILRHRARKWYIWGKRTQV